MRPWAWVGLGVGLDLVLALALAFFVRDAGLLVGGGLAALAVLCLIGWSVDGVRAIAGIVLGALILGPVAGYLLLWVIALAL